MMRDREGRPPVADGAVDGDGEEDIDVVLDVDSILPDLTEFDPALEALLDLTSPPPPLLRLSRPTLPEPRPAVPNTTRTARPPAPAADGEKTAWAPPVITPRETMPETAVPTARTDGLDVPDFLAGAAPEAAEPETPPSPAAPEVETHEHDIAAELMHAHPTEAEPSLDLFATEEPADRGRLFPGGDSDLMPEIDGEPAFIDRIASAHETRPHPVLDVDDVVGEPSGMDPATGSPAPAWAEEPLAWAEEPSAPEPIEGPPDLDAIEQPPPPAVLLPSVPLGEPDGFALQLGAGLGAELGTGEGDPAPPELEAPAPAFADLVDTGDAALDAPSPQPEAPGLAPVALDAHLPIGVGARLGPAPCVEPSPVADIAELFPRWRRHLVKAATIAVAAAAVVALLVTNPTNGGNEEDTGEATGRPASEVAAVEPELSLVAEAAIPFVDIYESPDDLRPRMSLEHPTEVGGPLVFLVHEQRGEWLHVSLPVRPNGSSGWVKGNQVRLSKHDFRVVVRRSQHRLELYKGDDRVLHVAIAVGTRDTPTPGGTFYIKELLKPPDPDTVYGNFAFGLSGFSNVLDSFNGGEGVIGIHGTNDPSVIGTDVSSGCIRLTNEDMLELVGKLPLGTPVEILA